MACRCAGASRLDARSPLLRVSRCRTRCRWKRTRRQSSRTSACDMEIPSLDGETVAAVASPVASRRTETGEGERPQTGAAGVRLVAGTDAPIAASERRALPVGDTSDVT